MKIKKKFLVIQGLRNGNWIDIVEVRINNFGTVNNEWKGTFEIYEDMKKKNENLRKVERIKEFANQHQYKQWKKENEN